MGITPCHGVYSKDVRVQISGNLCINLNEIHFSDSA